MTLDTSSAVSMLVAALLGAGGTIGAQKLTSQPQSVQQLQFVENMTGICLRIDRPPTAFPVR